MSKMPEALRLADSIEGLQWDSIASSWNDLEPAAAELRRQHEVIAELLGALRLIAETDWVDAALDPQRAVRVAQDAIAKVT